MIGQPVALCVTLDAECNFSLQEPGLRGGFDPVAHIAVMLLLLALGSLYGFLRCLSTDGEDFCRVARIATVAAGYDDDLYDYRGVIPGQYGACWWQHCVESKSCPHIARATRRRSRSVIHPGVIWYFEQMDCWQKKTDRPWLKVYYKDF